MKQLLPVFSIVIVVGVTIVSGIIHGQMSNRWSASQDAKAIGKRLQDVPEEFGDWRLESSGELSESAKNLLQPAGYFVRTYVNQESGESVKVSILFGPRGPISVHTPDVCFSSRDYRISTKRERVALDGAEGSQDEFWAMTFQSRQFESESLRVYYAWSPGSRWSAPKEPRWTFGDPWLYKIQLASSLLPEADLETHDPCREFLKDFLPVVRPNMAGSSAD